ncbi:MAG TPA: hypothetical protein VMT81_02530 [Candidatus Paceibacterota bacterium]|nr:hypothetical protein [Candidatus Paceibacterota bacterium]
MRKGKDVFTGELFEPENTNPPELLTRNEKGEIVDKAGNIYDESGQLICQVPDGDSHIAKARTLVDKHYAGEPDDYKRRLAEVEARFLKRDAQSTKHQKNETDRRS